MGLFRGSFIFEFFKEHGLKLYENKTVINHWPYITKLLCMCEYENVTFKIFISMFYKISALNTDNSLYGMLNVRIKILFVIGHVMINHVSTNYINSFVFIPIKSIFSIA